MRKLLILLLVTAAFSQVTTQQRAASLPAFTPYQQSNFPALAGLSVSVSGGTITISGVKTQVPSVRLSLAPNTTTNVYVDMVQGLILSTTSAFTSITNTYYPVATVTTNGTQVITLTDVRPDVFYVSGAGTGTITSVSSGTGLSGGGASGGVTLALQSALPNGQTATTQSTGDTTTKVATNQFVANSFASPPALGSSVPAGVNATTLSASGAVSGTGFTNLFASPPAIGGTAAAAVNSTTFSASGAASMASTAAIAGPRPWIDVTQATYGADPTGVSDSATAINSAVAACPNGGTVLIPPGTYIHNSQITLGNANCVLKAYGATIKKNYNSSAGRPGPSGSIVVTAAGVRIEGLTYDGNCNASGGACAGNTGICITNAANVSGFSVINSKITNCEVVGLNITSAASYTNPGPTNVQIAHNYIQCPAVSTAVAAISLQGQVGPGLIEDNILDCGNSSYASGPGTIEIESQGLTTSISNWIINGNTITCPGTTNQGWCIQSGGFNAYTTRNMVYSNNILLCPSGGTSTLCGGLSLQNNLNPTVTGNTCNFNGMTINYTCFEVIGTTGGTFSINTFYTETPGTACAITVNQSSKVAITGNNIYGFGQAGDGSNVAGGICVGGTHAQVQIGSMSESSNTVTVTVASPPLPGWIQPGLTINLTGATTAGYNISGLILDAGYSRTSGTFTIYNPTSGLGACSGGCTSSAFIQSMQSNNVIADNIINLPCQGTLTNNRYGILVRPNSSTDLANANKIQNNTIIGCGGGATGDFGIRTAGSGTQADNVYADNKFINLATGFSFTQGTGNMEWGSTFTNVTTQVGISGSPTFAASETFNVPTADVASCAGTYKGKSMWITSNTAAGFATAWSGVTGANNYQFKCNGTSWLEIAE